MRNTALLLTAFRRPYYFKPTLESWANTRGFGDLNRVAVALGHSDRESQMWKVISTFPRVLQIIPDRLRSGGLHRAIGEGLNYLFKQPDIDYVIYSEEDIIVSTDALELAFWGRDTFANDKRVLACCLHCKGSQGWDPAEPMNDEAADQERVQLLPYFSAWGFGVWKDRWEDVLKPTWDYDCNSGGAMDSGWDWNIATRVLPQGNFLCAVPDASRTQNVGFEEGWASTPLYIARSQSKSFRDRREPVKYKLAEDNND